MERLKNKKIISICFLSLITAFRAAMFVSLHTSRIAEFGVLLVIFGFLSSLLIVKTEKSGEYLTGLLLLGYADIYFFLQNNCVGLAAAIIWVLCALNLLREKPIVNSGIALAAASAVSTLLLPGTVLSYVPLGILIYLISGSAKGSKKNIIFAALAAAMAAAGCLVNKLILMKNYTFEQFMDVFSFGSYSLERPLSLLSVIPLAVLGILLIKGYLTEKATSCNKAGKSAKQTKADAFVVGIVLVYAAALAGLIMKQTEMYFLINLVVPVSFAVMALSGNAAAKQMLVKVNSFFKAHPFALLAGAFIVLLINIYSMEKMGYNGMLRMYLNNLFVF